MVAGGAYGAAPVTFKDAGAEAVLDNGVIAVTLTKARAAVKSIRYRGHEMVRDGYYSMDGGANYRQPAGCVFEVVKNTPELVLVKMTRVWKDEPQAFDIDIYYALRRGDSGVYTYATLRHDARHPATGYGEWRMVWKLDQDLLEKICVDDKRHFEMQKSTDKTEPTPIKEITRILSGVRAGQLDCKYDYSASYYDLGCWGHASDRNKIGAFMVLGSKEFFNDGPTKQDLNAAYGINHIHFGMNHFNGSNVKLEAGEVWSKTYGPFLLYVNSGENAKACWDDAKARVVREHAEWPYAWVESPDYPKADGRGEVRGKIAFTDALRPGVSSAGAWVGLAAPDAGGNWQFESERYQFWTKVGADGSFTIPHVRPGTYTLYAFGTGAVGEFARSGVVVEAGGKVDLGELTWEVPHAGRSIAWEIGVPDRTAREFRGGDDYWHGYLWETFDEILPNPLVFTVGSSDPAKVWNYAQTRYGERGVPHPWEVRFDLASEPAAGGVLTFAIASAQRANVTVNLNGTPLKDLVPTVQGGNALLRLSIHAKYCVERIEVPPGVLKAGPNVLKLTLKNTRDTDAHVMYDYLNLELK
jgi:rhamnogalacturonan endolyase